MRDLPKHDCQTVFLLTNQMYRPFVHLTFDCRIRAPALSFLASPFSWHLLPRSHIHIRTSVMTQAQAADSDDDFFGDVGFMFDGALPKARRLFCFGGVSVPVRLVDANPGAVQSGHYLWPAAPALSAYLIEQRRFLPGGAVLELGAGCGLGGLVAAQLPGSTAVVFTDHDPGVLAMIRESIEEQAHAADSGWNAAAAKSRCVQLRWGPLGETQQGDLAKAQPANIRASSSNGTVGREKDEEVGEEDGALPAHTEDLFAAASRTAAADASARVSPGLGARRGQQPAENASFDLVIASDVVYSATVVGPLFITVAGFLSRRSTTGGPSLAGTLAGWGAKGGDREPECSGRRLFGGTGSGAFDAAEAGVRSLSGRLGESKNGPTRAAAASCHSEVAAPAAAADAAAGACHSSGVPNERETMTAPVFVMCQSFGYDYETEEAIDVACSEHGLEREVVWDDLHLAPARTQEDWGSVEVEDGGGTAGQGDGVCDPERGVGVECADKPVDERRSASTMLLPSLSRSRRVGTKLQLFRRA